MSIVAYTLIKQKDGYQTKLTHYSCLDKPKASIIILHGMAEHQNRYKNFADYLVSLGYDVFTYDHRGHGTDKKLGELGFIAPQHGYQLLIEDATNICNYIYDNNPSGKLFLLGHSMGSIIARNVIQTFDKFHGVLLTGTPYPHKLLTSSGLILASLVIKFKGPKHISPFLNTLMFGNKKYTSLSSRTAFDWLTRSNPVVGAYIHDPYCGFICTASFYHDLLKMIKQITTKKNIRITKHDLPLFLASGEKDPVTDYGKSMKTYSTVLKRCGFSNITVKLYPDCRHELLNELNRNEIYSDIQTWISKR